MANQRKSGGGSSTRSRSSNRSGRSSRQSGNGADPKRAETLVAEGQNGAVGEPDVLLDVPQLKVDEIGLEVDNLHARIALETRLGDMLQLYVGADVVVDRVALEIKGVEAQALLKARLHNVLSILDRTLQSVDKNPKLLTELARTASEAADGSGSTES
jgi:hypothetical protein